MAGYLGRRKFLATLGGAAATWPLAARAQQAIGRTGKMPRLGILMPGPAAYSAVTLDPFYRGLHELGYIVAPRRSASTCHRRCSLAPTR
jgi:hypothetical protein